MIRCIWLCLSLLPLLLYSAPLVYLTWQQDPTTTLTIRWVTEQEERNDQIQVRKATSGAEWKMVLGTHLNVVIGSRGLNVHTVELTNLSPDNRYEFRIGDSDPIFQGKTLPNTLEEPFRFVAGGDMYRKSSRLFCETCTQAAKLCPHFALVGGDLAYAGNKNASKTDDVDRWLTFVKGWSESMVTPEGDLIPIITCIGNHDVNGRHGQPTTQAPMYYALFAPHPTVGYHVLDVGDFLSVLVLDTGHTHPLEGEQKDWLFHTLQKRKHIPYTYALYHVPAYPSVRKEEGVVSPQIREHWVPFFENFQLTAAFENHDHAYKRTHLIYRNQIDPSGVLYLGDGGWGIEKPRLPADAKDRWYLAKTAQTRSFFLITLTPTSSTYQGIDETGSVIDTVTLGFEFKKTPS